MAEEKNKSVKKDRGQWFREMRSELKKVVWPTPDKVAKNTGTVLLYSAVFGAFVWVFDGVAALFIKTLLEVLIIARCAEILCTGRARR